MKMWPCGNDVLNFSQFGERQIFGIKFVKLEKHQSFAHPPPPPPYPLLPQIKKKNAITETIWFNETIPHFIKGFIRH